MAPWQPHWRCTSHSKQLDVWKLKKVNRTVSKMTVWQSGLSNEMISAIKGRCRSDSCRRLPFNSGEILPATWHGNIVILELVSGVSGLGRRVILQPVDHVLTTRLCSAFIQGSGPKLSQSGDIRCLMDGITLSFDYPCSQWQEQLSWRNEIVFIWPPHRSRVNQICTRLASLGGHSSRISTGSNQSLTCQF